MRTLPTRLPNIVRARAACAIAFGTAILVLAGSLMVAAPAAASSMHEPAGADEARRRSAETVLQCETRREFRAIDRLQFVVEPVARCAVAVAGVRDRVSLHRRAERLPARVGRGRSIHQAAEPTPVAPARVVRWSPDRSRLSNVQAERNRSALNGRIVRR